MKKDQIKRATRKTLFTFSSKKQHRELQASGDPTTTTITSVPTMNCVR